MRQERKLYLIHKKINLLWDDGNLDFDDIKPLEKLISETENAYAKGKINNERYTNLKKESSVLYEEIFKKRINLLSRLIIRHDSKDDRLLSRMKNDIDDAYAKGKLSKLHYDLLNKMISGYEGNK
jgi:predicted nuclease with TOPRIM domain